MSRTIQQQYQDALQDISNWQRSFNELEQQLKEAEKVIEFYGDVTVTGYIDSNEFIQFDSDNGKTAREYLKKYRGEK